MTNRLLFKVFYAFIMLMFSVKAFAFACSVDGVKLPYATHSQKVYVDLEPVIQPNQNLVVDLSQHISCWNSYGNWQDTDRVRLIQPTDFGGSLKGFKGTVFWNGSTYALPLATETNILSIGELTPLPLPLKLYLTPVGAAGGVVIKAGETIALITMRKISDWNPSNIEVFTWTIIAKNAVVIPTGGCDVSSRDLTVNLPDYPGYAPIPLNVRCASNQKLSFYLTGPTADSSQKIFKNLISPESSGAQGIGIQILRKGDVISAQQSVPLGIVSQSNVPLNLEATYARTSEALVAGKVQTIVGVTFLYE